MFGPIGKPEAEVFDIGTKKKVDDEGIMTLKSELGLPKGVEPGSMADKAIKESVEYKTKQQGVKSVLDEDYVPPKTTTLDEDIAQMEKGMEKALSDMMAKSYSAGIEGKRRAVIRQILLKDTRLNLPDDVISSLRSKYDLAKGADQKWDPLELMKKYYGSSMTNYDDYLNQVNLNALTAGEHADTVLKYIKLTPSLTFAGGGLANVLQVNDTVSRYDLM